MPSSRSSSRGRRRQRRSSRDRKKKWRSRSRSRSSRRHRDDKRGSASKSTATGRFIPQAGVAPYVPPPRVSKFSSAPTVHYEGEDPLDAFMLENNEALDRTIGSKSRKALGNTTSARDKDFGKEAYARCVPKGYGERLNMDSLVEDVDTLH
mmetsp:Transcript_7578/g.16281  ORF Transcript_7578/g.16281 Transcript_7578/m.16281 type:complete len:151 (+) Transcript_7578:51-503(+)